jgi:hypothetical protein
LWCLRAQRLRTPLLRSPSSSSGEDDEDDKEECSPLTDSDSEKLYHDTDERESYGVKAPIPSTDSRLC